MRFLIPNIRIFISSPLHLLAEDEPFLGFDLGLVTELPANVQPPVALALELLDRNQDRPIRVADFDAAVRDEELVAKLCVLLVPAQSVADFRQHCNRAKWGQDIMAHIELPIEVGGALIKRVVARQDGERPAQRVRTQTRSASDVLRSLETLTAITYDDIKNAFRELITDSQWKDKSKMISKLFVEKHSMGDGRTLKSLQPSTFKIEHVKDLMKQFEVV